MTRIRIWNLHLPSTEKIETSLQLYSIAKQAVVMKFVSFASKNVDFSFWVKKIVFDAAVLSSILYGCESRLGANLKSLDCT